MIGHGFWGGPGWGLIGLLLMVAFWILVVTVIIALVRRRGPGPTSGPGTALRVLEERYAQGEVDREEFLERRATLTGTRRGSGPPTQAT